MLRRKDIDYIVSGRTYLGMKDLVFVKQKEDRGLTPFV